MDRLMDGLMPGAAPRPLILASTSPYRRALLGRFGLEFAVEPPGVDEAHREGEAAPARAQRLALEKARAVAARRPEAWVIGSDQVGVHDRQHLDKPGDATACRAQLARLSGATAVFHTAVALVHGGVEMSHLEATTVRFRTLEAAEIARYVEREQPYDCAGAFKAEALGITLLERLETADATALVGLPLLWLADALRRAGYRLP